MALDRILLKPALAAADDLHGKAGRCDALEAAARHTPAGLAAADSQAVLNAGLIRRTVFARREEGTRT